MQFMREKGEVAVVLSEGKVGNTYKVVRVDGKEKTKKFLFTLGCFEDAEVTLISMLSGNYVVNIKDSRYAIDKDMAKFITVEQV